MFDVLFINIFPYLLTLIFTIFKFKRFNTCVLIWLAYTMTAIMGYYSVKMEMHYSQDIYLGEKLPVLPYIYAYLTTVLIAYPFYRFDERKINLKVKFPSFIRQFTWVIAILFIYQAVLRGISAYVIANTVGFGEAYVMGHEGEYIDVFNNSFLTETLKYSSTLTESVRPFYILYFFLEIIKKRGGVIKNLLLILIAFLPNILSAISLGSKGTLFFTSLNIIFYYLVFRKRIDKKDRKKIIISGAVLGTVILAYVFTISLSRFEAIHGTEADSRQRENEFVHYLGESYPNLGYFYYGKVKRHPNGERFFPEVFGNNVEDKYKNDGLDAKFEYWRKITHVPMGVFKTFWGDWYVEFGEEGSFIAITLFFCFFYFMWLRKYYKTENLGIVAFYFTYIVIQGCFTGSGFEGSQKHSTFILLVVISYLFGKYCRQHSHRRKKTVSKQTEEKTARTIQERLQLPNTI